MFKRLLFSAIPLLFSYTTFAQYGSDQEARDYLLGNVQSVGKAGVPGPLLLSGDAFPVMIGSIGGDIQGVFVAASALGEGHVLAFGHGGYLAGDNLRQYDLSQLLQNGTRWTSGYNNPKVLIRNLPDLAALLRNNDFEVEENTSTLSPGAYLDGFDVIIADAESFAEEELGVVQSFVQSGKGLVTAGLGWGWLQLNKGKRLSQMKGNRLLEDAGIAWIEGYMGEGILEANKSISPYFNVQEALNLVYNNPMNSVNRQDYGLALSIVLQNIQQDMIKPFAIPNNFPGPVPANAQRVTRTITIQAGQTRWISTGLYAAPGDEINVEVPLQMTEGGFAVRIGAHADRNYHHKEWTRHPELSLRFTIEKQRSRMFNPFGGLIYIEVPENSDHENLEVIIDNAIQAPRFVLGKTSRRDWVDFIRNYPAPWAELEGEQLIITLQSDKIRQLEKPDEVIRFWDQAQDNNRKLANWPEGYHRPMRIAFDRQISAGYMHAGYPIMSMITNYGEQEDILDSQGDHWGFYHELGHNHQHPFWTFQGTGEVTCNLFTLYNIENLQNKPRLIGDDQLAQKHSIKAYFNNGSPFEEWKGTAFLALHTYNQLIEVYGWQALENVIARYTQYEPEKGPKREEDKINLWCNFYSIVVGEDLSAYFEKWGWPISDRTKKILKVLPPADLDKLLASIKVEEAPRPSDVLERYRYSDGFFVKKRIAGGSKWFEQDMHGLGHISFSQYKEDDNFFYLRKDGTNMNLRIPKSRGWLQFNYDDQVKWNNLYEVFAY